MSWRGGGGGKGRWGHERTYQASQPLLSTTPSLINDMHTYSSFLAALKRHHQRGCAIVAFVKPLWPNTTTTTTLPDKNRQGCSLPRAHTRLPASIPNQRNQALWTPQQHCSITNIQQLQQLTTNALKWTNLYRESPSLLTYRTSFLYIHDSYTCISRLKTKKRRNGLKIWKIRNTRKSGNKVEILLLKNARPKKYWKEKVVNIKKKSKKSQALFSTHMYFKL